MTQIQVKGKGGKGGKGGKRKMNGEVRSAELGKEEGEKGRGEEIEERGNAEQGKVEEKGQQYVE